MAGRKMNSFSFDERQEKESEDCDRGANKRQEKELEDCDREADGVIVEEDTLYSIRESEEHGIKYDNPVKNVLRRKDILAIIIKRDIPELADASIEEIMEAISPDVDRLVSPYAGDTNEESDLIEKLLRFDVYVKVGISEKLRKKFKFAVTSIKFHIIYDLEAQQSFKPGYPLMNRATYYASRLLSAQLRYPKQNDKETTVKYRDLCPVYTVWLIFDKFDPVISNTRVNYGLSLMNANSLSKAQEKYATSMIKESDLIHIEFIFVDKKMFEKTGSNDELLEFLNLLFGNMLSDVRMKKYIRNIDDAFRKDVNAMEKYQSDFEFAHESGVEEGIEQLLDLMIALHKKGIKANLNDLYNADKRQELMRLCGMI